MEEIAEDTLEPPVPAGLGQLSPASQTLSGSSTLMQICLLWLPNKARNDVKSTHSLKHGSRNFREQNSTISWSA